VVDVVVVEFLEETVLGGTAFGCVEFFSSTSTESVGVLGLVLPFFGVGAEIFLHRITSVDVVNSSKINRTCSSKKDT
jgi:hypothetical protein